MYNILNLTSCKKVLYPSFFVIHSDFITVVTDITCSCSLLGICLFSMRIIGVVIRPYTDTTTIFFILSLFFFSSFLNLFTFYRTLLAGSVSAALLLNHPLVSGKPQITFKIGTDY